jgi:ComF family protein
MAERLRESGDFEGFDAVVPIPLHHRRERLRGYNQAELLAREIAASTGLPMKFLLARRRAAAPAWRLGKAGRQSELAGAFEARPESASAARGQRLLLIDDVCATGTTLEECAFALRRAGAVDVAAFVFARAGRFT